MKLCVAAIFRDEAPSITEWMHHYIARGVEDFILLNDRSLDDWEARIPTGVNVNVYDVGETPLIPQRQNLIYNRYLTSPAQRFDRLLLVDLDEFVWDENTVDLTASFAAGRWYQIPMTTFGSCGFVDQPPSIVEHFTRREMLRRRSTPLMSKWCVVPSEVKHYDFHYPARVGGRDANVFAKGLRLNHYKLQSLRRWEERVIRCGSANSTKAGEYRHSGAFRVAIEAITNKFEDTDLRDQNRKHGIVWKPPHYC